MLKLKALSAAVALVMTTSLCFAGCSFDFSRISYRYDNSEKYTAGDLETKDEISNINIDYLSGGVKLTGEDTDTVSVVETANTALTEDQKVHTWVDGNTLYIRYCASTNSISFDGIEKSIDVVVPGDVKLDNLNVDITSGSFMCSDIEAGSIDADTSSGSIDVTAKASDLKLEATSGFVILNQRGSSDSISLSCTSGSISAVVEEADRMNLDVTSGRIEINANHISEINSDITSGNSIFNFSEAPDNSNITSTSGAITVFMPEDSDITVSVDSTSGGFNYDLPFTKRSDKYIIGEGTAQMILETTSGDIEIKAI